MGIPAQVHIENIVVDSVVRGDSLVDLGPFVRKVAGSNPALAATYGPWVSPSLASPVALRSETLTQYPCCVGTASE